MPNVEKDYSYVNEWKSLWEPDLEAIAFNGATCDPTRVDPKVLQWVKHNCSHEPHFIKIINSNATHGHAGLHRLNTKCQLAVPGPFVKEHFRELDRVVTLVNDEGKTWRVSFGYARSYPLWFQGWKRVAADNDLKPGEVMVFVLVANSRFHFTRFDEDRNILGNKSPNSTVNEVAAVKKEHITTDTSASQSLEKLGSVTNTDDSRHGRTSWKSKRAAALASRDDPCGAVFNGHGYEATQLLAPAEKQIAEARFKRRRLCKVGEIMFKANSNNEVNVAINNEKPLYGSEEAGRTSMVDTPSTVTNTTSHPHKKHMSGNSGVHYFFLDFKPTSVLTSSDSDRHE